MRILVHDYAGHPFQVQLSRALARQGHTVQHSFCGSLPNTAHGTMHRLPSDPEGFTIVPVLLDAPLDKYHYVRRWRQERAYGHRAAAEAARFQPDVVLSANTPLDAQTTLQRYCRQHGIRFVFWLQDLLSVATDRVLRDKIPVLGAMVGRFYLRREAMLLRRSDAVVLITEDFEPILGRWGVPADRMHVIPNWAPLDEMPRRPRRNAWAQAQGLTDVQCFLYAGNLGIKHNPELLLRLARRFDGRDDVRVVVISQGLGADWLRTHRDAEGLRDPLLLPFQPFEDLPDVLATADVLVALLEPDAGVFSVPSKVLSYLCAERPVLLAVPPENLAARIVARNTAGRVVPPHDADGFEAAAQAFVDDPAERHAMGENGRRYAETHFDVEAIATRFAEILADTSP